jgi:hypothetical protein
MNAFQIYSPWKIQRKAEGLTLHMVYRITHTIKCVNRKSCRVGLRAAGFWKEKVWVGFWNLFQVGRIH